MGKKPNKPNRRRAVLNGKIVPAKSLCQAVIPLLAEEAGEGHDGGATCPPVFLPAWPCSELTDPAGAATVTAADSERGTGVSVKRC